MSTGIQKREPNAVSRLLRETTAELRKVTWPTRQEAISLTWVVIVVMIISAIILGGLDALFFEFFGWLLGR